jgi:hypothetical protein
LTQSDFFYWGSVKDLVYFDKFWDLNHLKAKIREATEQEIIDMLQRAWQEVEHRLAMNHEDAETY